MEEEKAAEMTAANETAANCSEVPSGEVAALSALSFWCEGVLMLFICVAGLMGNGAAVPVLLSRKLASTFNRLLVFLAVYDSAFLLCAAAEALRRHFLTTPGAFQNAYVLLFVHFLYPAQNVALVCSAYATVVLAVERYLAVTRPVEYHLSVTAAAGLTSPWRRVWRYMAPTLALGVLFNLPKFFEFVVASESIIDDQNASLHGGVNETRVHLKMVPTEMRLDFVYVFAYVNLAKLLVEGLIPFCSLVFLNRGIHRAIVQRRLNQPGAANASSNGRRRSSAAAGSNSNLNHLQSGRHQNDSSSEDNRQSLVLFFVVASFLICNVPRVVLNVYETLMVGRISSDSCFTLPVWVTVTAVLSYVLIAANSSVNFFLYCLVNPTFRQQLVATFGPATKSSSNNNNANGRCRRNHAASVPERPSRATTPLMPQNETVLVAAGAAENKSPTVRVEQQQQSTKGDNNTQV